MTGLGLLLALAHIEGVALPLYPGDQDFLGAVDEIAGLGATHVSLPVFWRQRDVRANQIAADPRVTISDEKLRDIVRRAHARKLEVMIFPIVELDVVKRGEWRGTMAPADPASWWLSYETFILHYATIAAEEKVAILSVGSELGSTETWRERWWHLIGKVKRAYPGKLIYSANWDHYRAPTFWSRLDYMGVSAYDPVADTPETTADDMSSRWKLRLAEMAGVRRGIGLPLVLTEVGLPSRDGAAMTPWDYTRGGEIDLEEQRRGYQAFFGAWDAWDRDVHGAFIWHWFGTGGPRDGSYTPRGKPAEAVLRKAYGRTGILGP